AQAAAGDSHVIINLTAYLARFCVWLTRRILWVLMYIGALVSSLMLRQMEFDADRYEARVEGSDMFAVTSERIIMLTVAQNAAFHALHKSWREGRLGDDLPRLLIEREKTMPDEVRKAVRKKLLEARTGWFDSHPCHADRIASAKREEAPGIVRLDGPARVLFH